MEDGVVVKHVIEAGDDDVTFLVTATNPTDKESLAHWAQPCMRVDKFVGGNPQDARQVYPPYIHQCFLRRWKNDATTDRAMGNRGEVCSRTSLCAGAHVDRNDVNPRPLSALVPSSGLTGCYSNDEKLILAVAWEPYQEIFQGVITCMHADFRIGGLRQAKPRRFAASCTLFRPTKLHSLNATTPTSIRRRSRVNKVGTCFH